MSIYPEQKQNRSSTLSRLWDRVRRRASSISVETVDDHIMPDSVLDTYSSQSSDALVSQSNSSKLKYKGNPFRRSASVNCHQAVRSSLNRRLSVEQVGANFSVTGLRPRKEFERHCFIRCKKHQCCVDGQTDDPSGVITASSITYQKPNSPTAENLYNLTVHNNVQPQEAQKSSKKQSHRTSMLSGGLRKDTNNAFTSEEFHLSPKLYPQDHFYDPLQSACSNNSETQRIFESSSQLNSSDSETIPTHSSRNEFSNCSSHSGNSHVSIPPIPIYASLSNGTFTPGTDNALNEYDVRYASLRSTIDARHSFSSRNLRKTVSTQSHNKSPPVSSLLTSNFPDLPMRVQQSSSNLKQPGRPTSVEALDLSVFKIASRQKIDLKNEESMVEIEQPSASKGWTGFSLSTLARLSPAVTPRLLKHSKVTNEKNGSVTVKSREILSTARKVDEAKVDRTTKLRKKRIGVDEKCIDSNKSLALQPRDLIQQSPTTGAAMILSPSQSFRSINAIATSPPTLLDSTTPYIPLICRLGNGKYTKRVFVVRAPTKIDEDIILVDSAQTRVSDIRRLFHSKPSDLNSSMSFENSSELCSSCDIQADSTRSPSVYRQIDSCEDTCKSGFASTARKNKQKQLWPGFVLWDLPINRSMISSEVKSEFHNQVLTYRLLDTGAPSLLFITQLCNSILYWLKLDDSESQGALISFYETDPMFLAILGCILLCLENQAILDSSDHLPRLPRLEDISRTLNKADVEGRLVWNTSSAALQMRCRNVKPSDGQHFSTSNSVAQSEQPQISSSPINKIAAQMANRQRTVGVLGWRPLDEWTPSGKRVLASFRKLLSRRNLASGLRSHPFRIKTLIINKFPGPASGIVIEIYQIYDLNLIDGHTRRNPITQKASIRRATDQSDPRNNKGPAPLSCRDNDDEDVSSLGSKFHNKFNKNRKQQSANSSTGYSTDLSDSSIEKKKKGLFGEITSHATKSLWGGNKSKTKEMEERGCHLLGPYGFAKSQPYDDSCQQLRLLADNWDYGVVSKDDHPSGNSNVVFDFTQTTCQSNVVVSSEQNDSVDETSGSLGRSVIMSGDVLIVFRQLGYKHLSSCKKCQFSLCSTNGTKMLTSPGWQHRRTHQNSSTVASHNEQPAKKANGFLKNVKYKEGGEIFALFSFHTGFMGNGGQESDFRLITKDDLDIPSDFYHLIPDDLEIHLLLEPSDNKFVNAAVQRYTGKSYSKQRLLKRNGTVSYKFSELRPTDDSCKRLSDVPTSNAKYNSTSQKAKVARSRMSGWFSFMKATFGSSSSLGKTNGSNISIGKANDETKVKKSSIGHQGVLPLSSSLVSGLGLECAEGVTSDEEFNRNNFTYSSNSGPPPFRSNESATLINTLRTALSTGHTKDVMECARDRERFFQTKRTPVRRKRHSHQCTVRLDLWRWKLETIRRPYPDIEEFIRRHPVVVIDDWLKVLRSEGYQQAECCAALKVTNNDYWAAVQFLGRYSNDTIGKQYRSTFPGLILPFGEIDKKLFNFSMSDIDQALHTTPVESVEFNSNALSLSLNHETPSLNRSRTHSLIESSSIETYESNESHKGYGGPIVDIEPKLNPHRNSSDLVLVKDTSHHENEALVEKEVLLHEKYNCKVHVDPTLLSFRKSLKLPPLRTLHNNQRSANHESDISRLISISPAASQPVIQWNKKSPGNHLALAEQLVLIDQARKVIGGEEGYTDNGRKVNREENNELENNSLALSSSMSLELKSYPIPSSNTAVETSKTDTFSSVGSYSSFTASEQIQQEGSLSRRTPSLTAFSPSLDPSATTRDDLFSQRSKSTGDTKALQDSISKWATPRLHKQISTSCSEAWLRERDRTLVDAAHIAGGAASRSLKRRQTDDAASFNFPCIDHMARKRSLPAMVLERPNVPQLYLGPSFEFRANSSFAYGNANDVLGLKPPITLEGLSSSNSLGDYESKRITDQSYTTEHSSVRSRYNQELVVDFKKPERFGQMPSRQGSLGKTGSTLGLSKTSRVTIVSSSGLNSHMPKIELMEIGPHHVVTSSQFPISSSRSSDKIITNHELPVCSPFSIVQEGTDTTLSRQEQTSRTSDKTITNHELPVCYPFSILQEGTDTTLNRQEQKIASVGGPLISTPSPIASAPTSYPSTLDTLITTPSSVGKLNLTDSFSEVSSLSNITSSTTASALQLPIAPPSFISGSILGHSSSETSTSVDKVFKSPGSSSAPIPKSLLLATCNERFPLTLVPRKFPGYPPGLAPGSTLLRKPQLSRIPQDISTKRTTVVEKSNIQGRQKHFTEDRSGSSPQGSSKTLNVCSKTETSTDQNIIDSKYGWKFGRSKYPGLPPRTAPGSQFLVSTTESLMWREATTAKASIKLEPNSDKHSRFPGKVPGLPPYKAFTEAKAEQKNKLNIAMKKEENKEIPKLKAPAKKGPPPKGTKLGPPKFKNMESCGLADRSKAPLGRKIFWKPLKEGNIEGTIFAEIGKGRTEPETAEKCVDVSAMVDSEVLSRLFVKQGTTKQGAKKGAEKKPQGRSILDAKRAHNVSIVLARLKFPPEIAVEKMCHLDREGLTSEELDKIESVSLLYEEDQQLEAFFAEGGKTQDLRVTPEQRILPLRPSKCFRLISSIGILRFMEIYSSTVADLKKELIILQKATDEVKSSSRFRQVLSVVLRWGNYINYGVAGGDLCVRGFTLGSLLKLCDFKTTIDSSITSLHYLTANMLHAAPELGLHLLLQDMPTVLDASKLSTEALNMNMGALVKGVEFLRSELDVTKQENDKRITQGDGFLSRRLLNLVQFQQEVATTVVSLQHEFSRISEAVYETSRFFGDESAHQTSGPQKNFPLEAFFKTLREFLIKFNECCRDVLARPKKYAVLLAERKPAKEEPMSTFLVHKQKTNPRSRSPSVSPSPTRNGTSRHRIRAGTSCSPMLPSASTVLLKSRVSRSLRNETAINGSTSVRSSNNGHKSKDQLDLSGERRRSFVPTSTLSKKNSKMVKIIAEVRGRETKKARSKSKDKGVSKSAKSSDEMNGVQPVSSFLNSSLTKESPRSLTPQNPVELYQQSAPQSPFLGSNPESPSSKISPFNGPIAYTLRPSKKNPIPLSTSAPQLSLNAEVLLFSPRRRQPPHSSATGLYGLSHPVTSPITVTFGQTERDLDINTSVKSLFSSETAELQSTPPKLDGRLKSNERDGRKMVELSTTNTMESDSTMEPNRSETIKDSDIKEPDVVNWLSTKMINTKNVNHNNNS